MKQTLRNLFLSLALLVACCTGMSFGQTGLGTFGAADIHEYDIVSLSTLTPTITSGPIFSKAGLIPIDYAWYASDHELGRWLLQKLVTKTASIN